jgi:hypothetical protein
MSHSEEWSSGEDELEQASNASTAILSSQERVEKSTPGEPIVKGSPWVHARPGEPWVDMDKIRPPPDYIQALKCLSIAGDRPRELETCATEDQWLERQRSVVGQSMMAHGTPAAPPKPPPPGLGYPVQLSHQVGQTRDSSTPAGADVNPPVREGFAGSGREGVRASFPWLLDEQVLDEWVDSVAISV